MTRRGKKNTADFTVNSGVEPQWRTHFGIWIRNSVNLLKIWVPTNNGKKKKTTQDLK